LNIFDRRISNCINIVCVLCFWQIFSAAIMMPRLFNQVWQEIEMHKIFMILVLLFGMAAAWAAVNINTASSKQLQSLPHIGVVKAQAIIDYRDAHGSFQSTKDIMRVRGIGKATYEKLQNDICVSGGSVQPAVSASKYRRALPATATR
jgi:competence protein ComEA